MAPAGLLEDHRARDFLIATPLAPLWHVLAPKATHPPNSRPTPTTPLTPPALRQAHSEDFDMSGFARRPVDTTGRDKGRHISLSPVDPSRSRRTGAYLPCCFSTAPPCSNASPSLAWNLYGPGKGQAVSSHARHNGSIYGRPALSKSHFPSARRSTAYLSCACLLRRGPEYVQPRQ